MSRWRENGLLHLALYQAGWFACVLGASHEQAWWGTFAGLLLIGAHLALMPRRGPQLRLLLAAGLFGAIADSAQSRLGLLTFRSGVVADGLAPPWIVVMWMQFSILYRFGLSFLLGRYLLAAALGAVGGPLAYYAGHRLGAVSFGDPPSGALAVLAVVWATALPLLAWIAARVTGVVRTPEAR